MILKNPSLVPKVGNQSPGFPNLAAGARLNWSSGPTFKRGTLFTRSLNSPPSFTLPYLLDFELQQDCKVVMRTCRHSHWLDLTKKGTNITLTYSDRAQTLLHGLPFSESQQPSLFVLIGNASKATALKELSLLTPERNFFGSRGLGEIHLHIDASALFSDRPILFAEGDLPVVSKLQKPMPRNICHEVQSRVTPRTNLQATADELYYRLLGPFTDVFCFFAKDLGGLQPIAQKVLSWMKLSDDLCELPRTTFPRILIVTELPETQTSEDFFRLLRNESSMDPLTCFSNIRILRLLPDGKISSLARHRRLKEVLMETSDQVRLARKDAGTLFSAAHFAAFTCRAIDHFVAAPETAFNFIRASRRDNPPAKDLTQRLTRFLTKVETLEELKTFAIPHIASTILLDNYPPGMHRKSHTF